MCILLKLHSAKFDVSSLFCSKVIEENLWGNGSTPLVKEGLILLVHNCYKVMSNEVKQMQGAFLDQIK